MLALLTLIGIMLIYASTVLSEYFFWAFASMCAFSIIGYAGIVLTTPKE